jgi:hypothetical protein
MTKLAPAMIQAVPQKGIQERCMQMPQEKRYSMPVSASFDHHPEDVLPVIIAMTGWRVPRRREGPSGATLHLVLSMQSALAVDLDSQIPARTADQGAVPPAVLGASL